MKKESVILALVLVIALIGTCTGVAWLALAAMGTVSFFGAIIAIDTIKAEITSKKYRALAWSVPSTLLLFALLLLCAAALVVHPMVIPHWIDITFSVISIIIVAYFAISFCIVLTTMIAENFRMAKRKRK